jgi:ADP-ribose pyrophosphatase YjhB (NUDIX family)
VSDERGRARPTAARRVGRAGYRVAYLVLYAYSRIVRPHTRGVKCMLVDGDDVLLVRHSYGPGDWDLPGGFCRRGEAFADAARREVAEELRVSATRFTDLGELRTQRHGRRETLHAFRIDVSDRTVAIRSVEVSEWGWFPRRELPAPLAAIVRSVAAMDAGLPSQSGG